MNEAVMGCDCDVMVVGSIPTRGDGLLFINIFLSSLWCPGGNSPAWWKVGNRVF